MRQAPGRFPGENHDGPSCESLGPFARGAPNLITRHVVAMPVGGDDGKRAFISGWQTLSLDRLRYQLPIWLDKYAGANVAIVCGASGLVIVDVDDACLHDAMLVRFGQTNLIIRTPSGGYHLYYRAGASAVRSRNLRNSEGIAVEIKSIGTYVVAPPSVQPVTGAQYTVITGSWDTLAELPTFSDAQVGDGRTRRPLLRCGTVRSTTKVEIGQRNNKLFRELLKHASACDDFDALLDIARTRNECLFDVPLPYEEVVSTSKSAWRYECEGRNWVGKSPKTILSREELLHFAKHKSGGDALLLWCFLLGQHRKRNEAIVVDREAMATANVLPGWTVWRFRKAIDALRQLELLRLVEGGERRASAKFVPNRYLLARPVAEFRQNVTGTVLGGRRASNSGKPP